MREYNFSVSEVQSKIELNPESVDLSDIIYDSPKFEVEATGIGLNYQWQLQLPNGVWTDLIDEVKPVFYPLISKYESGQKFRCIVSNSVGSVTSGEYTLNINKAVSIPTITNQPTDLTVDAETPSKFVDRKFSDIVYLINGGSGESGTTDYTQLSNLPTLNGNTIIGNMTVPIIGSYTDLTNLPTLNGDTITGAMTIPVITSYTDLTDLPTLNGDTITGAMTIPVITSYTDLTNLPSINNVSLSGNKTAADLGLQGAVTNTIQQTINITTAETGIQLSTLSAVPAQIIVAPKLSNTGAIYLVYNSSTYTGINPIYPDPTNNTYEVANASLVYIFGDNAGDSVDLTISYRG